MPVDGVAVPKSFTTGVISLPSESVEVVVVVVVVVTIDVTVVVDCGILSLTSAISAFVCVLV